MTRMKIGGKVGPIIHRSTLSIVSVMTILFWEWLGQLRWDWMTAPFYISAGLER